MNKAADNYTGGNYDEFIALSKVQLMYLYQSTISRILLYPALLSQRMNIEHNRVWS